jgi:hypothetical protein
MRTKKHRYGNNHNWHSDNYSIFEQAKRDWIDNARSLAKKLLKRRSTITIEDVLERLPRPRELHPNITGAVFREGQDFHLVGYKKARHASANHRAIGVWSAAEDE